MKKIILICLLVSSCSISNGVPQYQECLKVATPEECEQLKTPKVQSKEIGAWDIIPVVAGAVVGFPLGKSLGQ